MGVNSLWSILAPVKTHKPLKSLKGQTIAVDLSVWICESASALQGVPVVKPHLRNIFFRVTNLTQMGVNLIFVLDGEPPELKWEEMERRTKARFEGGGRWGRYRRKKRPVGGGAVEGGGVALEGGKKKRQERKRFKFVVKECAEMLSNLGIPCVQAAGEAEAMCALLNKQGLVDACLTEDGDVFLYGARTVYKNFSLNIKDPHIECYSMDVIESQLGLGQSQLIALSLLLGCDYTLGISGIGPKLATSLLKQIGPNVDVLDRFRDWADGNIPQECLQEAIPKKLPHCSKCKHVGSGKEHKVYGCAVCKSDIACYPKTAKTPTCSCPWHTAKSSTGNPSIERDIMKKACANADFPNEPVIEEFLSIRDICPGEKLTWKRPRLIKAKNFVSAKLEWPEDYTVEKVFPLVTLWDLTAIASGQSYDPMLHMKPASVVKKRVRQGVACVEIQWQTGIPHSELECPITIEREDLFKKAFPKLLTAFEDDKAARSKQKRKKAVKSTKQDSAEDTDPKRQPACSGDDLDSLTAAVTELSLISKPSTVKEDTATRLQAESELYSHPSGKDEFAKHSRKQRQEAKASSRYRNCTENSPLTSSATATPNYLVISDSTVTSDSVAASHSGPEDASVGHLEPQCRIGSRTHHTSDTSCRPRVKKANCSGALPSRNIDSDRMKDKLFSSQQHLLASDEQLHNPVSSKYSVSTSKRAPRGKPLKALSIKTNCSQVPFSSADDDSDDEPLPLSARLKLKKVFAMKVVGDSAPSSLSSGEDPDDGIQERAQASHFSARLHFTNKETIESFKQLSSSEEDASDDSVAPSAFDMSSVAEQALPMESSGGDEQEYLSSSESGTPENSSLTRIVQSSSEQILVDEVLDLSSSLSSTEEMCDRRTSSIPGSASFKEHQFKESKTERSSSVRSVSQTLGYNESSPLLSEASWFASDSPEKANFSLGFSVSKLLMQDESLHLNNLENILDNPIESCPSPHNVKETSPEIDSQTFSSCIPDSLNVNFRPESDSFNISAEGVKESQPQESCQPTSLPPLGTKYHPNFSLRFELTNMLDDDDSFLLRNEKSMIAEGKQVEESERPDWTVMSTHYPRFEEHSRDDDFEPRQRTSKSVSLSRDQTSGLEDETTSPTKMKSVSVNKSSVTFESNDFLDEEVTTRTERQLDQQPEEYVRDHGMYQACERSTLGTGDGKRDSISQPDHEVYTRERNPIPNQGVFSSSPYPETVQTPPQNMCKTIVPSPIDVETPTIMERSSRRIFNQSETASIKKQPYQPLREQDIHKKPTDLKRSVLKAQHGRKLQGNQRPETSSQCASKHISAHSVNSKWLASNDKENTSNHSLTSSSCSQSAFMLHEDENSPVSLMDRLKLKHGKQNGVLSAALTMTKSWQPARKPAGKCERKQKVLMDIFDDDNEDDSIILN